MRRFVLGSVVLAFIAAALPVSATQAAAGKTVEVMLFFKEGAVGTTLPAINGQQKTWAGRIGDAPHEFCHIQGTVRLVETESGSLRARVHDEIYLDESKKTILVERSLRIFPMGPPAADRGAITVAQDIRTGAHIIDPNDTIQD
jgi:hypothetical protein